MPSKWSHLPSQLGTHDGKTGRHGHKHEHEHKQRICTRSARKQQVHLAEMMNGVSACVLCRTTRQPKKQTRSSNADNNGTYAHSEACPCVWLYLHSYFDTNHVYCSVCDVYKHTHTFHAQHTDESDYLLVDAKSAGWLRKPEFVHQTQRMHKHLISYPPHAFTGQAHVCDVMHFFSRTSLISCRWNSTKCNSYGSMHITNRLRCRRHSIATPTNHTTDRWRQICFNECCACDARHRLASRHIRVDNKSNVAAHGFVCQLLLSAHTLAY